ncbi:MAG: hypothetical protein P4L82_04645 [Ancalomicrobiaceae bacterium]|nr:hypothetical protein [Ancalomicrobiaceae bacterium]
MNLHRARDACGGTAFKMAAAGGVGRLSCDFAGRRAAACCREEGRANKGGGQKPTERGQDKSRQCAARSGYCFSWAFSPFRQCAPDPRNVRADIKLLLGLSFPHIAGAGDGA